jgi:hypothetical protein
MLDNVGSVNQIAFVRAYCEHAFVSTTLDTRESAFLSGFVAGDGSFTIRANNAGASWCCGLQVKLRADNTPLLATFRDWTGAGELFRAPARGGSAPQTAWMVSRRADCERIVEILDSNPPLGKAAREFDLWRAAVSVWSADGGGSPVLAELGAELRARRDKAAPAACPVDISTWRVAAFLAGFASAEAHFGSTDAGFPSFTINLRADDEPLLALFHRVVGVGHLRAIPATGSSRPAASWRVGRRVELRRLAALFDDHPPRGRAADVYSAWRELVLREGLGASSRRALAEELRRRRRFVPGLDEIEPTSCASRSRSRSLEALRQWAASEHYPGGATAYEHWRRVSDRSAPSRNTVAAAFGSWLGALEAAGLDSEHSFGARRVAAMRAGHSATTDARRARSRALVLDAVRRCIAELGREPGAQEFLAWRRERAPESPSQMTIYRAFPGGFDEVVAVAQGRLGMPVSS